MLNENIKRLRQSFQISQVELAKQLGVSKQCVSNWENDNVLPSIDMLVKLARYFDVSTDSLLDLDSAKTISVDGLNDKEISHIKCLVQDLLANK